MRVLALAVSVVLLAGCGPAPGSKQCTWSGAKSGTATCRLASAAWLSATNVVQLRVLSEGAATSSVSAEFELKGKPAVGSFVGGVGGAGCAVTFTDSSAAPTYLTWVASTAPGQVTGSCTVTLNTVTERAVEPAYTVYEFKGSFSATLQGAGGATGTLELAGGF